MTVRGDFQSAAANVSAITDILGTDPVRLRWNQVPQGETVPYSRFFQVTRDRQRGHDGPAGLSLARLQVEHFAETPDDAETLADAFTANLDALDNGTVTLLLADESDAFQIDATLFQIRQDWDVQWVEN